MEDTPSLLYKIKPLADRLPSVKRPEGHVHFRTKMMWVIVILVLYFVMTNVYLYGLDQSESLDLFAQYRTIMAGASGSLLQLGIGPIVTASIIMQLFVGAKIIKLDLSKREDKACYQSVLKLLVIVMIVFEAIPQVFGYLVPSAGAESLLGSAGAKLLLIVQLFAGSYIIFMMDEVVSKWGIGSGISLFIAAGVAQSLFTGALNWNPIDMSADMSLENPPGGTIPRALYYIFTLSPEEMASGGYESLFLGQPNPMIALVGTFVIFLLVAYLESTRIELPLSHGNARGARGRYPIKLMYASNIPVILMSALLAIVSMVTLLLYSNDFLSQIPGIGGNSSIGYFEEGSTTAAGGIAWYLSAPQGLTDWLMPILDPAQYGNGHNAIQNIAHVGVRRQPDPEEWNADPRIPSRPACPEARAREVHPHDHDPVGSNGRRSGGFRGYGGNDRKRKRYRSAAVCRNPDPLLRGPGPRADDGDESCHEGILRIGVMKDA